MNNKTDIDAPRGKVMRVADFLPPPSELVPREETVKVTLSLNSQSVAFLKEEAKKNHVPYQRMIRHLIDHYVQQHR